MATLAKNKSPELQGPLMADPSGLKRYKDAVLQPTRVWCAKANPGTVDSKGRLIKKRLN